MMHCEKYDDVCCEAAIDQCEFQRSCDDCPYSSEYKRKKNIEEGKSVLKEKEIDISNVDLGKVGEWLFGKHLRKKAGVGYVNLNSLKNENNSDSVIGKLVQRNKLVMNYTKRNKGKTVTEIPFKFDKCENVVECLTDILSGKFSTIDYFVVIPSDREKVTHPSNENCFFIEVKSGGDLSQNQQKAIIDILSDNINCRVAEIDFNLDATVDFKTPEMDKVSFVYEFPCGKTIRFPKKIKYTDYWKFEPIPLMLCMDMCPKEIDPHDCESLKAQQKTERSDVK